MDHFFNATPLVLFLANAILYELVHYEPMGRTFVQEEVSCIFLSVDSHIGFILGSENWLLSFFQPVRDHFNNNSEAKVLLNTVKVHFVTLPNSRPLAVICLQSFARHF